MNEKSGQSGATGGGKATLLPKLFLAGAFLLVMIGVFAWAMHTYVVRPALVMPLAEDENQSPPAAPIARVMRPATIVPPKAPGVSFIPANRPTFRGKVLDAQTHQPVDGVVVMPGYATDVNSTINYSNLGVNGQPPEPFDGGQYQINLTQGVSEDYSWYLRVQAHGYLPAVSAEQHGLATVDFELTPAKDIVGHVYGADGKPAANVFLAIFLPASMPMATLLDGKLTSHLGLQTVSGADGAYDLWPETGDFEVVAASPEAGLAILGPADFAKSPDIHLSAWTGVEGRVMLGSKPAAGAIVSASSLPINQAFGSVQTRIAFSQTVTADADGHYSAPFTMPGQVRVARMVQQQSNVQGQVVTANEATGAVMATIAPGRSTIVNIGGGGRAVMGKIVLPASVVGVDHIVRGEALGPPIAPVISEMPDSVKNSSSEVRQTWLQDFGRTMAGGDYLNERPQLVERLSQYAVSFDDKGGFHIDDLQPGDYLIEAQIFAAGNPTRMIAEGRFTMPPITADLVDQPLEIPDITPR